jgi:superfamily II RNA helicase
MPDPNEPLPFGVMPDDLPPHKHPRAGEKPTPTDGGEESDAPAWTPPNQEPALPRKEEVFDAKGRVIKWGKFTLQPFQIKAIEAVRAGQNVLVAAPTGAGKTLVAEYAALDAVHRGRRVIYTAPIKALSSQKYRDFKEDPNVHVGIMTGDVTISAQAQVLVMTTEILRNAIFENSDLVEKVEYVVFDEVHFLDDRERGMVWEECLIFLPPHIRLICLSATISNVTELGAWIGEVRPQKSVVIHEERRPVPLSHWMHSEASGTFDPGRLKIARKKAQEILDTERSQRRGERRRRRGGGRGRGGQRPAPDRPDSRSLIDELVEQDRLPALVFSFSRKDVERLAHQNQRRELLNSQDVQRMHKLQDELLAIFQLPRKFLRGEIMQMALGGVAYHHAGLLPVHKELVERMFTAGLIKLLFTTETFALGINMPARSVIFSQLRKFDGISFDWLRTRDYLQMAGRAGRQGIDPKGWVYSVLGNRDLVEAPLERLFAGKPEPVTSRFLLSYSTILHLVEAAGRDRLQEAFDCSFSQFQARGGSKKARAHQRDDQRRAVKSRLRFLESLGYLEGEEVSPRGKIARLLSGHEVQVTQLLFSGCLEEISPQGLMVIFVGLIHEERGRFRRFVPKKLFGDLRGEAAAILSQAGRQEHRLGIEPAMKQPDWGLTEAAAAWYEGAPVEELEDLMDATPGDFCRVLRMSIQLMRNTKRAIDVSWDLGEKLDEAVLAINRDEIDARRQLRLG